MADLLFQAPNFDQIGLESGDATRDAIRLLWLELKARPKPTPPIVTGAPAGKAFGIVAAVGQPDVVADSPSDTLTLQAGSGISFAFDPTNDIVEIASSGGSGTPSAPDQSIQFNEGGAFGGDAEFIYDTTEQRVELQGALTVATVSTSAILDFTGSTYEPSTNKAGGYAAVIGGDVTVPDTVTHNRYGVNGIYLEVTDDGDTGTINHIWGTEVYAEASGASQSGSLAGAYASATRSGSGNNTSVMWGGLFDVEHDGTGVVQSMVGVGTSVEAPTSGAGTVTSAEGLDVTVDGNGRTGRIYGHFMNVGEATIDLYGSLIQVTQPSGSLSGTMYGENLQLTTAVGVTGGVYGHKIAINDTSSANNQLVGIDLNVNRASGSGISPNVYGMIIDAGARGDFVNGILITTDHNPATDDAVMVGLFDNSTMASGATHDVDKFVSIILSPAYDADTDSNLFGGIQTFPEVGGDGAHDYVFGGDCQAGIRSGSSAPIAFASGIGGGLWSSGTGTIDEAYGSWLYVSNLSTATMTQAAGLLIYGTENSGGGTVTTNYGLKIEDQTAGTTDYSIYTGAGEVSLGDVLRLRATYTVATLPASPALGMVAVVTDALAPVWGANVAGTGAAKAFVWYNGANWTVMGK